MAEPFRVLAADPPWRFGDSLPGPGRGASKHYATLPVDEICLFPLPEMADNSILFLWRVSSMVEEAYKVVRSWGFTPKTELVWKKKTKNDKRHFGMGRIVRAEHETCIVATMGRPEILRKDIRSTFEAEEVGGLFEAVADRRHSKKPDEFFQIVESLSSGPYVELFARTRRPGWSAFGNELDPE